MNRIVSTKGNKNPQGGVKITSWTKLSHAGYNKKKATFFPKGVCTRFDRNDKREDIAATIDIDRPIKRHDIDYFNDLAIENSAGVFTTPDADGVDGNAMLLRPRRNEEDLNDAETNANQQLPSGQ